MQMSSSPARPCAPKQARRSTGHHAGPLPIASARSRACRLNSCAWLLGVTIMRTSDVCAGLSTSAAMAKSSTRPLAQEPMKQWVIYAPQLAGRLDVARTGAWQSHFGSTRTG